MFGGLRTYSSVLFLLVCCSTWAAQKSKESSCHRELNKILKEETKKHGWHRRAYFKLRGTAKTALNQFLDQHPEPTEEEILSFRRSFRMQLEEQWNNFISTPRKALVVASYFLTVTGVPLTVAYITSDMPTWVMGTSAIVSGLLAANIFNPSGKPFLMPLATLIEKISMRAWGQEGEWHKTYAKYSILERDIALQVNNAIISLEPSFRSAREALENNQEEKAVRFVADAAMRLCELFGGLSPDNLTMSRFFHTVLGDDLEVPFGFRRDVLEYIDEYYRSHDSKLPSFLRTLSKSERDKFFRRLIDAWITPLIKLSA